MKKISLNGAWKLNWCDGQRGGAPHYVHGPGEDFFADIVPRAKTLCNDYDNDKWMDCMVPSEVHQSLLEWGIIDNPYQQGNVLKCRWIEDCVWYYRKTFEVEPEDTDKNILLRFECLDYDARIYLNQKEIGTHKNVFYPLELDITGQVKCGENELIVKLDCGLHQLSEKPIKKYFNSIATTDMLLHKRLWMRKPQFETAWDWSNRLINVGIQGNVELIISSSAIVKQCWLNPELADDYSVGKVTCHFDFMPDTVKNRQVSAKILLNEKEWEQHFSIENALASFQFEVPNPQLWYPVGMGAQYLYHLHIDLYDGDGNFLYTCQKQIGFKKVEVVQTPHPVKGRYFQVYLNGIFVFLKGANLVPNDMIISNATPQRYDALIDNALKANFNFLRVWGGGVYETEYFYDLCEQKGILVWQEFISACGALPFDDEEFAQSCMIEFRYQAKRLAHRACLVAWCGNNELDWMTGDQMSQTIKPDYSLYHFYLPKILKELGLSVYYQPSSPYSMDSLDLNDELEGDQHAWSVGFEEKNHFKYRQMECRFPNEGGALGPTSLETVNNCLAENQKFIHSFSWRVHDNTLEGMTKGQSPDNSVKYWMKTDPKALSIEEYVYIGGYLQGEALGEYIQNFRRRKGDSGGVAFWMYNDCWPCTRSWTIIDYYIKPDPVLPPCEKSFSEYCCHFLSTG